MKRLDLALLVYDIDTTGGMERQARQLAERLAERGARVRVITSFWVDGLLPRWPRGVPRVERRGRLSIVRLALPRGWSYLGGLQAFELVAAWLLAARPPDALYAVQWTAGVHGARLARLLGRPLVTKLACGGVHGDMAAIAHAEDPRALETLRRSERVVCLSPQIEAEALAAGFAREQLVAIPNGVDLARFGDAKPAEVPGLEDAERVLFVGALRQQKHLPTLLGAFARVAASRPRARLLIAGNGPEEAPLRTLAHNLQLTPRVHFLGRRDDVPGLLAAAHVFVLPSESEGLSNALLEALAAGTPVIASDIEGNRALVTPDREALLVPLDDEAALAAAITKVLEDRALAAALATAGKARAREFALDAVAERYERAFASLARPRLSSLELVGRYLGAFENPGLTGLVTRAAGYASRRLARLLRERLGPTRRATSESAPVARSS